MEKKDKLAEKKAIDFMRGKEGTHYKSDRSRRWLKNFIRDQRNGCKPGEAFDYKTDKCKAKSAIFVEAYFRNHKVKALDKFGRVIDVGKEDIKIVADYLFKIPNISRINELNMITPIGDFPKVAKQMLKHIREYEDAEKRM